MRHHPGNARLTVTFVIATVAASGLSARADDVATRWNAAVSGQWDDATRWSNGAPVSTAPPGTAYDATIDATGGPYTVQINPNSNARADSVVLDSADAVLRLESGILDARELVVRRGEVLMSGSPVIRNATIYYTPGAILGGARMENVSFATDVTFTGGATSFPTGLDTGGHTITFFHADGFTHAQPFGVGTHISGGGTIVSDAEHGFESMYVYAPGGSMTVDAGITVRTGSGNVAVGPADSLSTDAVLNLGTLRAGATSGGAYRSLRLTNVTNGGHVITDDGRIDAFNLVNEGHLRLAGRGAGNSPGSLAERLLNRGTVTVEDGAALVVRGLENHGRIDVTGARLGVYDETVRWAKVPLVNTGTIALHDAELELGVAMPSDGVDGVFTRTGTRSLIVQATMDNAGRTITVSAADKLFVGAAGRLVGGTVTGAPGGFDGPGDAAWGTLDAVTIAVDWAPAGGSRTGPRVENGLTLAGGARVGVLTGLTFGPATAAHVLGGTGIVSFDDRFAYPSDLPRINARDLTIAAGVTVQTGVSGGIIGDRAVRPQSRLTNLGTLRASAGQQLELNVEAFTNAGTLHVADRGTVVARGSIVNTGTVTGNEGFIVGNLRSDGAITISPGTAGGWLIVNGDVVLGEDNTLSIEIGGPDAYDRFATAEPLTLGGTLEVTLLDAYVPPVGSAFEILWLVGSPPSSGSFTTLDLPALPDDRAWDVSGLAAGRLAVVPEPAAALALLCSAAIAALLPRRRPRRPGR